MVLQQILNSSFPIMVKAGAGSGKSYSLVEKVKHTIKSGINPSNIMVSTFTKDAALELQKRIGSAGVQAGTLHSLMWQIVKKFWHSSIYILDDTMFQKMAFTICKENKLNFDKIPKYRTEIGYMKNGYVDYYERLETDNIPWSNHDVASFAREYKTYCEKWHKLDFDDMILFAYKIFIENPQILNAVQEDWKYLFLDEAQDFSPAQSEVIELLKSKYENVFIIGDIKQNIYSGLFNSNSNYFKDYDKNNPKTNVFVLPKTYRCERLITDNANEVSKVIDGSTISTVKESPGNVLKPSIFESFSDEVDFIASEAIKRFNDGSGEEIRILFRTNAQALRFQLKLIEAGIPFSSKYENNIFRKKDVRVGLSAIDFMENGLDMDWEKAQDIIKDMKHLLTGIDLSQYYKFVWDIKKHRANPMKNPSVFDWFNEISSLNQLHKKLQSMSPSDVFNWIADEKLLDEIGDNENLYGMADFFEDCKNLKDVNARISQIAKDKHKINPDERAIILSTIHGSKGLESDVVFVCGVADGLFPIQFENTDPNEELRLFYVAITRAKKTLYVTGCKSYGKKVFDKNSYLDYIVHVS